ncbi:MAG: HAMP domain-containing sensor histidine kinase [Candidatus Nanopelagicales bacterium]
MKKPASLSRRLPLLLAIVALITGLAAALIYWPLITRAADTNTRQALGRTADLTAETIAGSGFEAGHFERLGVLLDQQDANGWVVPANSAVTPPLTSADVAAVTGGQVVSAKRRVGSETYFVEGRPVSSGLGVLLVQPAKVASALSGAALARLGLALLAGLIAALGIGYVVARRMTRPLVQAAAAADAMSSGQRDIRIDPGGPAEVAGIAVALNDLAAALQESEHRQREFFLTVSHELRTPLTSLKGYSEALADGVVDEAEVPQVAAIMAAEADHLDRLVADLLDLARLGAVDVSVQPVLVDLSGIGRDAAASWSGRAARAGVAFGNEVSDAPVWVLVDPIRVRQIIDNLMENAMRVTAEGQPVILRVAADPVTQLAVVQVRDGGPGLTGDDLKVAFEPGELHQRYKGVRKVGSGVGLALVSRLAQRLGGHAQAGVAREGGAMFTVSLPLAPHPDRAHRVNLTVPTRAN